MKKAIIFVILIHAILFACKESDSHKLKRLERYRPGDDVVAIADAPIALGLTKLKHNSMAKADFSQALAQDQKPDMINDVFDLVRVKDGDTIVVTGSSGEITVRLLGIDTPEMRDSRPIVRHFAEQAKLLVTNMLEGKQILLGLDPINERKDHTDYFGRLLAYVYTADDSLHVNAEIVRQGYGFSFVKYPCMYTDYFSVLEREARAGQRGLWAFER